MLPDSPSVMKQIKEQCGLPIATGKDLHQFLIFKAF